jgi:hypothetical protein
MKEGMQAGGTGMHTGWYLLRGAHTTRLHAIDSYDVVAADVGRVGEIDTQIWLLWACMTDTAPPKTLANVSCVGPVHYIA